MTLLRGGIGQFNICGGGRDTPPSCLYNLSFVFIDEYKNQRIFFIFTMQFKRKIFDTGRNNVFVFLSKMEGCHFWR